MIQQAHRDLAREAVRKSLVLLKNGNNADEPFIPLSKKARKILVTGTHAHNLGYQCGGWTIAWQGLSGNNHTAGKYFTDLFQFQLKIFNSSVWSLVTHNFLEQMAKMVITLFI